jgi:hypothetical protein
VPEVGEVGEVGDRLRSPALDEAAYAFVQEALEQGPQAYGLPLTLWTLRALQALLQALLQRERARRGSGSTLQRVVHGLG